MDLYPAKFFPCTVCGLETDHHAEWFLVVENRWLDTLKILSWHPLLAEQAQMQSVCGKHHLKTLLTHWLTHANLQFLARGTPHLAVASDTHRIEAETWFSSVGKLVGELSVHRDSLSSVWSGSRETLECILNALIGGMGTPPRVPEFPVAIYTTDSPREYALLEERSAPPIFHSALSTCSNPSP
jgi:hypothetical protein